MEGKLNEINMTLVTVEANPLENTALSWKKTTTAKEEEEDDEEEEEEETQKEEETQNQLMKVETSMVKESCGFKH